MLIVLWFFFFRSSASRLSTLAVGEVEGIRNGVYFLMIPFPDSECNLHHLHKFGHTDLNASFGNDILCKSECEATFD